MAQGPRPDHSQPLSGSTKTARTRAGTHSLLLSPRDHVKACLPVQPRPFSKVLWISLLTGDLAPRGSPGWPQKEPCPEPGPLLCSCIHLAMENTVPCIPEGPKSCRVRKMTWSWCSAWPGSWRCCEYAQRHTCSRLREGFPCSIRLRDCGARKRQQHKGQLEAQTTADTWCSLSTRLEEHCGPQDLSTCPKATSHPKVASHPNSSCCWHRALPL